MVIDTSVLIAILLGELEGNGFIRLIGSSPTRLLSAASLVEASIVIESKKGQAGHADLDLLIQDGGIENPGHLCTADCASGLSTVW